MLDSRILNNKRELSADEKKQLVNALSKWYPAVIQTYNTSLYDMMASPLKMTIIHSALLLLVIVVCLALNQQFGFILCRALAGA